MTEQPVEEYVEVDDSQLDQAALDAQAQALEDDLSEALPFEDIPNGVEA